MLKGFQFLFLCTLKLQEGAASGGPFKAFYFLYYYLEASDLGGTPLCWSPRAPSIHWGIICQDWSRGLQVTSRQPKGVKLGISKIANYISSWIKMFLFPGPPQPVKVKLDAASPKDLMVRDIESAKQKIFKEHLFAILKAPDIHNFSNIFHI